MMTEKIRTFLMHPYAATRHGLHVGALEARRRIEAQGCKIHQSPIFVLGNQKAGTTAVAALLAKATGLDATLDLVHYNDNAPEYDKLYRRIASFKGLINANRKEFSRPIIKEPHLTFFQTQLREFFPLAKFVFVMRDPRDNIRSILNHFKLPGNQKRLTPDQWDRIDGSWKYVFDGSWLGLQGDNYIDMLAERWCAAARAYLDHADAIPLFRYEDFMKDQVGCIRGMAICLQLDAKYDIHLEANRQNQSRGDNSMTWEQFFGRANLDRINSRCSQLMAKLGYA